MENFIDSELNILKDDLLIELFKDAEMPINTELTDEQKNEILYALIVSHSGEAPHEKLLLLQNKFLKNYNKKLQKSVEKLNFKRNFCETNENILNFNVDLLVVATENILENSAALAKKEMSLDNEILFRAGIEFKANLLNLCKQKLPIYFLSGYNLNANTLAKIVINQNFDEGQLLEIINSIFKYTKENEIKTMAMDFSVLKNLENGEKFLKIVKKHIEKQNKLQKIKIIFKNFL